MGIIETLLLVLFVVSAILLIIIVLMQDDQGEGLGGIFGGGSSTPFGSSSGNVLTKITGVLGVLFIVSSLGLAFMVRTPEDGDGGVLGEARRSNTTEQSETWWSDDTESEDQEFSGYIEKCRDDADLDRYLYLPHTCLAEILQPTRIITATYPSTATAKLV